MIATQEDVISLLKNTLAVLQMFLINSNFCVTSSNFRASTNFLSVDLVDENKGVYEHPKLVSRESH